MTGPREGPRQHAVLVVDDTVETRRLIGRLLERDDFRVLEAGSGPAALRSIALHRPDIVVLDLGLPGMSGLDVARAVREHPDPLIRATPLLACSASVEDGIRREALDAGCDDFCAKPFDVATFARRVLALLSPGERDRHT